jgi:hypothetical protein
MNPNQATLSVPPSVHMTDLLADGTLCKNIATFHSDLQRILVQTQLDVVTEQNRDTVGPTLLGLKHVQDILLLFKAKGDLLLNQQTKANANTR